MIVKLKPWQSVVRQGVIAGDYNLKTKRAICIGENDLPWGEQVEVEKPVKNVYFTLKDKQYGWAIESYMFDVV